MTSRFWSNGLGVGPLVLAIANLMAVVATAQELGNTRDAIVEEVRNRQPAFLIRVDVDHPDRIYRDGDMLQVSVRSERAGYLYLVYVSAADKVRCLFPNEFQQDNKIPATTDVKVPGPDAAFRIRVGAPFGEEVLKAIVSLKPLQRIEIEKVTKSVGVDIGYGNVKDAFVEELKPDQKSWAEHDVRILTVPKNTPQAQAAPRRIGIFIGISKYADPRIRRLSVSHNDAQSMANALRGQLDHVEILVNEAATLQNIEEVIRKKAPALTRPGDLVLIYWSGHGGRCAAVNPREKDGLSEYLVPYDGKLGAGRDQPQGMLLDDTFGRWVQQLDGRQVVVLLDTCYSGGQATGTKDLEKLSKGMSTADPAKAELAFNFLEKGLERAKDIGQKEAAVLASSKPTQISFERREGDLSTMTFFLNELLTSSASSVTLPEAYQYVSKKVPEYVEARFPGTTQTPVLVDQTTPPVFLKKPR